jgi:hypothetical protein
MKWKYLREHHRRQDKAGSDEPVGGTSFDPELRTTFPHPPRLPRKRHPQPKAKADLSDPLAPKVEAVFYDESGRAYRYDRGHRVYS